MGVAHTLARHFFWFENILWKDAIMDKPVTVALGGRDLIVDTRTVRRYLTGGSDERVSSDATRLRSAEDFDGDKLDVLWFDELDQ